MAEAPRCLVPRTGRMLRTVKDPISRPVQPATRIARARQTPEANDVLALLLCALALGLGVTLYGYVSETGFVVGVGVVASMTVGLAMVLRARETIKADEAAYARLDQALANAERSRDRLAAGNEELRQANVQLRAIHIALSDALNLADERSHGRMRELIEDTGEELAELLEEQLERHRR